MRYRILVLTGALFLSAHSTAAQTLEERVASLELKVAELWEVHEAEIVDDATVPPELVGNEHLRWGYPGGDCTFS